MGTTHGGTRRLLGALVAGATVVAGCSSGGHRTGGPTTATTAPALSTSTSTSTSTSAAGAVTTGPSAGGTSTTAPPTTTRPAAAEAVFAAIAGYYGAGTADGGSLYVRPDGAARFTAPDDLACPKCTTATAPLGSIDFSLHDLSAPGPRSYRATGVYTATSDPVWARQVSSQFAIGAPVSLRATAGTVSLSFLPSNDQLRSVPAPAGSQPLHASG